MRPRLTALAQGFAAIGLAAAGASLIDYLGAAATFCAESGCTTVRESAWVDRLGVPMPVLGVAFFTAALVLGFVALPRWVRQGLAVAGGGWAVFLILLQGLVIDAWCKLCVVADLAAIGYAVAVLAGAGALRLTLGRGTAAFGTLAAAVGALALWTHQPSQQPALPDGTPEFVVAAQVPGTTTVVEVVDFECPFCRRIQAQLNEAIAQARRPVRVVRKMLPLHMHPHALPAAIAYCCADAQGKGEAMAAALFAAPPGELTAEGCEKIAASVGCDLERYRRDLPASEARVTAETAEMRAAGIHALPTLFVGGDRIVGAGKSTQELTALLDRAH